MSRSGTAISSGGTAAHGRPRSPVAGLAGLASRTWHRVPHAEELRRFWDSLGWYPWLWAVLAATTAVTVLTPGFPLAIREPTLATVAGVLGAGIGLTVLYMGALRFSVLGQRSDLYMGLGFGCLGSASLFLWVARLLAGHEGATACWIYISLLPRALAAALFTASIVGEAHAVPSGARRQFGLRSFGTVGAVLVLGSLAAVALCPALPRPVDLDALSIFSSGAPVIAGVPGQALWLPVLNAAIACMFIAAAAVFAHRANDGADRHADTLALATSLIAFAQVCALLAPPVDPDYVAVGDAFALMGYILLLGGMVARLGSELSDHVSREERLRLSRELHDGLAQHLGLLHLRLTMATAPNRDPEQKARDLVTARRLSEVAILEARQAVMALRNDVVLLDRFRQTVEAFVGEFALNHEIEVRITIRGNRESVGADMQAEVLRILHEAMSNAVRHGSATVVTIDLEAGPAALEIHVTDNGTGFDPEKTSARGVGLLSIRERIMRRGGLLQFRSSPGAGASLAAWIPVAKS